MSERNLLTTVALGMAALLGCATEPGPTVPDGNPPIVDGDGDGDGDGAQTVPQDLPPAGDGDGDGDGDGATPEPDPCVTWGASYAPRQSTIAYEAAKCRDGCPGPGGQPCAWYSCDGDCSAVAQHDSADLMAEGVGCPGYDEAVEEWYRCQGDRAEEMASIYGGPLCDDDDLTAAHEAVAQLNGC